MENIRVVPDNNPLTEEAKAEVESSQIGMNFKKALRFSTYFCLLILAIFVWQQWETLSLSYPIDNGIFGTFGDFIGGVLGTIVALYSAYLLVRTFQNQIKTNANVVKTNESAIATNKDTIENNKKILEQNRLQIFDSRFNTLLNLYQKSTETYTWRDDNGLEHHGREAFEMMALSFRNMGFKNHTEYKRRSIGAESEYRVLYSCRRRELSVHLRMLYLLCKLTAEEKMKEVYRVSYVKSIRGQLSEGELLLLRYNGYSPYGQKMCQYINHFNLLKHLPVMSLLEFTYWRNMIGDERKISAIDQIYIMLKQTMTQMLDQDGANDKEVRLSSRYVLNITVNDKHDCIILEMTKQTRKKKGGAVKRPPEEIAFDAIRDSELKTFLKEFFVEMFVYSNFFQFNGEDHNIVSAKIAVLDPIMVNFKVKIERSGKPLALAQRQVVPVES